MGHCLSVLAEVAAEQSVQDDVKPHFRLSSVNPDSVPAIPYKDQIIRVKICDVHDGDTISVILAFGDFPVKIGIRIVGIDTPEIRSGKDKLPQEKVAELIARDHVRSILGEYAKVKLVDWDKFGGRMLAEVYMPDGTNLASNLVAAGYAKAYYGEKKQQWTLAELTSGPYAGVSRELVQED